MIAVKLGKYLKTLPAIQNKVSDRIYIHQKPQGTKLPNVLLGTFSGSPEYTLSGAISDLAKVVQVDVDSAKYLDAIEIAELIRVAIEYHHGTWDDTVIHSVTVQNETDQVFPQQDASDDRIFRRSVDYKITYER
jgi:hypothetical protein